MVCGTASCAGMSAARGGVPHRLLTGYVRTFDWVVRLRPDGLYWPVPPGWLDTLNRTTVYQ